MIIKVKLFLLIIGILEISYKKNVSVLSNEIITKEVIR